MSDNIEDRTLALAGILQACQLADDMARRGVADSQAIETSLGSLFQFEPERVTDIYGGADRLGLGLRLLEPFLTRGPSSHPQLMRYLFVLIKLERALWRQGEPLRQIGEGLRAIAQRSENSALLNNQTIDALAQLYTRAISPISPRVMVNGEPNLLQNPHIVARIRALLLAAIRSALLWRQCGGNRFNLILARRQTIQTAERLLRV